MCGVACIYAYHPAAPSVDRDELRTIRDHMVARGPDGKGEWYSPDCRIGLGHRRLSIIDLSERAAQPMSSADGRLVISFNGEIYNFRSLRAELERKGRIFRTESDTEVLLHLYEEEGEGMFQQLRGMFAIALWDDRKQALLLARDPYGIKPMYYADDGWTLWAASQIKALLASPRVSRQEESAGLVGFYLFGSVPEPWTLYQEIRAIPAGCYVWISALGPATPKRYFSLAKVWGSAQSGEKFDVVERAEAVRAALMDSVRHHMVADVPVGAFLSSGIDSGTLVGLMSEISSSSPLGRHGGGEGSIKTITLAFEEFSGTPNDEAPLAARVAAHYGTQHTKRIVTEKEFHHDLHRILEAMDQPSIDGINTWFVSKAAKEAGLKVAVAGLGGDELSGGYPTFRDVPRWVRWLWLPAHIPGLGALAEQVLAAFSPLLKGLSPKAAGMLRYGGRYSGAYLLRRGLFLPRELPALLGAERAWEGLRRLRPQEHIANTFLAPLPVRGWAGVRGFNKSPKFTPFAKVAILESSLYMRNQLLRDTDWASMAHSLEVRVPLIDTVLVRRLAPILASDNALLGKAFLAKAPVPMLPAEVTTRAKTGFTTPIERWQQRLAHSRSAKPPTHTHANSWARQWATAVWQAHY